MHPIRTFHFIIALLVSSLILTAFQVQVSSFQAVYQGSDIRLEWRVSDEAEVSQYEIYRKKESDANYTKLTDVAQTGSGTYSWVDDNLYKNGDGVENISYRLSAVTSNGPKFFYANIQHSPTAVQRSWGSIKSMFR